MLSQTWPNRFHEIEWPVLIWINWIVGFAEHVGVSGDIWSKKVEEFCRVKGLTMGMLVLLMLLLVALVALVALVTLLVTLVALVALVTLLARRTTTLLVMMTMLGKKTTMKHQKKKRAV